MAQNTAQNTAQTLCDAILGAEVAAARVEGAFAADPALGQMWRAHAALREVCRSVGLEDIAVSEADLVARDFDARQTNLESARGGWHATRLLRVIKRPGGGDDIAAMLRRCLAAGIVDEAGMPDVAPDLVQAVTRIVAQDSAPLVGAIRAAHVVRAMTEAQSPSAERLVFICVDHIMRSGRMGTAHLSDADLRGRIGLGNRPGGGDGPTDAALVGDIRADWVFLPSCALVVDGFRAWSPASPQGRAVLIAGLRTEAGRALGMLPVLRRWRSTAYAACVGRHGKSRLRDFVDLAMVQPVLTSRMAADRLGVTPRTGLNLMAAAQEAGIMDPLVDRPSYRVWAPRPMAETLRHTPRARAIRGPVDDSATGHSPDQSLDQSAEQVMADLDAALAQVDAVLGER